MSRVELTFPDPAFVGASADSSLAWAPSPEALVGDCVRLARAPRPPQLERLAQALGAPAGELLTTPLAARVTVLAAADGRAFHHLELRGHVPLARSLWPELALDGQLGEEPAPRWEGGVRRSPKYFSGQLEAPLASYDPNHRIKWRSHELLHRLVGFFWRPDLSRFEAYLGARLGELLPVVHWYGLDEILRARCEAHQADQLPREQLTRELCAACEDASVPYWQVSITEATRRSSRAMARSALAHLREELAVIRRERQELRAIASPRGRVDGSSDAEGYLHGHWNRITGWSFGAWVELFLEAGRDHRTTIDAQLEHVASIARRLLTGRVEADPARARMQMLRRQGQDLGYRALQLLELDDSEAVEAQVLPAIEDLAAWCRGIEPDVAGVSLTEAREQLAQLALDLDGRLNSCGGAWPSEGAAAVLATAWLEPAAPASTSGVVVPAAMVVRAATAAGAAQGQQLLEQGLTSALPESFPAWRRDQPGLARQQLATFASSEALFGPGELGQRWLRYLGQNAAPLMALEGWLRALPRGDEEAELFAGVPETAGGGAGRLRLHRTLRRGRFPVQAVRDLLGFELPDGDPVRLAAVWVQGEPRVLVEDTAVSEVLDALAAGAPMELASPVAVSLCEGAFLVWLPDVAR